MLNRPHPSLPTNKSHSGPILNLNILLRIINPRSNSIIILIPFFKILIFLTSYIALRFLVYERDLSGNVASVLTL